MPVRAVATGRRVRALRPPDGRSGGLRRRRGVLKRVHVIVAGQVQGVFFRDTTRRLATSRGVAGWVRNNRDGTVEAVFEGEAAAVDALVAYCREGPRGARVEDVKVTDEPPEGIAGFEVR